MKPSNPPLHEYEYCVSFAHLDKLLERAESTICFTSHLDAWDANQTGAFFRETHGRIRDYLRAGRMLDDHDITHIRTNHPLDHPAILSMLENVPLQRDSERLLHSVSNLRISYA